MASSKAAIFISVSSVNFRILRGRFYNNENAKFGVAFLSAIMGKKRWNEKIIYVLYLLAILIIVS